MDPKWLRDCWSEEKVVQVRKAGKQVLDNLSEKAGMGPRWIISGGLDD